jgi:DME family drug/metabolite transporter
MTATARDPALAARLAILGAAVLWSTGGAAIKLTALSAPRIAGGRALIAALVLLLLVPAARGRWSRPVLWTALAYAATCTLFVFANRLTTAGNAIFIQNTAPVWVLLVGPVLLGERPSREELLSIPISLLGCVFFFLDDLEGGRLAGNLCAAAASLSYALLIVAYRKLSSAEGVTATVAGNVVVAGLMAPLALDGPAPGALDLAALVYLGALQQAGAALLFIRGIRGVSALEGALLILFEPLLSPVWAFLLVGERLGPWALLGAGLILGATVLRLAPRRSAA